MTGVRTLTCAALLVPLVSLNSCTEGGRSTPVGDLSQVASEGTPRQAADLRGARVTLEAWVSMWNSYDLDHVDSLFVTDESATYFSSETEGLISGHASLLAHWLEDIRLDSAGTGAVATAIWYFQRTTSDDEVMRGPVTFVLSPTEVGYRIQHANFGNY